MGAPIQILVKTTILYTEDDWHIGRFTLMRRQLESMRDASGHPCFKLVARDRIASPDGDDVDLARLDDFDELWLIAADVTGALTSSDITHINEFRTPGGGVFLTRDHQDLGACLTRLGPIGTTQHFHTVNPEDLLERQCCDDQDTSSISWPNYHSGANGDLQLLEVVSPVHPVLRHPSGEAMSRARSST